MSERELRLRARIDALSDERDQAVAERDRLRVRTRTPPRRCGFCGKPCKGRACTDHADVERFYQSLFD